MPREILGVGILGIGGDEVVHVFLDVMYAGAPYTVITRAMHIHPTVVEYMPMLVVSENSIRLDSHRKAESSHP
jgi:pyruvate/2-oxoglutarate dehydrogenase complex dihydrolipoamide dehydrogenase (E3) component